MVRKWTCILATSIHHRFQRTIQTNSNDQTLKHLLLNTMPLMYPIIVQDEIKIVLLWIQASRDIHQARLDTTTVQDRHPMASIRGFPSLMISTPYLRVQQRTQGQDYQEDPMGSFLLVKDHQRGWWTTNVVSFCSSTDKRKCLNRSRAPDNYFY